MTSKNILNSLLPIVLVSLLPAVSLQAEPAAAPSKENSFGVTHTIHLPASKDNTLVESATGALSNGIGEYIFAGQTFQDAGESLRRALLAFDVAGGIPSDATIVNARLDLEMNQSIAGPIDVALHSVTADWGEGTSNSTTMGGAIGAASTMGDATWIHTFFSTSNWSTAGGDFDPTASATTSVDGNGSYSWTSVTTTSDVQGWLDTPATNFGWILIADEATTPSAKRFNSRESTGPSPALVIDFNSASGIFFDGFESGDFTHWSATVPLPDP